ncbi:flippase [Pseudomonas sp. PDM33]|uniref:flippase n=1 Tax=Pseudomonas sp. PDM33 TaxID=2854765 RepID=UPI001C4974B3|nr:flippase [Pseudomonas sp. PDM33]MBV7582754.1 flippase [Pseudomonas sp. PDM33]
MTTLKHPPPDSPQEVKLGHVEKKIIIKNASWLFLDKILRMGVGVIVSVWVARYLGPDQYGWFSYLLAFLALFGTISSLGLNGIVVREILEHREKQELILGTSLLLQLATGVMALIAMAFVIMLLRPEAKDPLLISALLGSVLLLKSTETIKFWFEANLQAKYFVAVENGAFLIISACKVLAIYNNSSFIAFIYLTLAEAGLVSFGLLFIYKRVGGNVLNWRANLKTAQWLIRNSWPLVLSSVTIMIYMRIDQIMIGQLISDDAVGMFTAAVRISEVWYFIPTAVVTSIFPSILKSKKRSESEYLKKLQVLYNYLTSISIALAIIISFSSELIITKIYGKEYAEAGKVLSIHIWAGVFVFSGIASSKWFIIENLQKFTLSRTTLGAITNIILNSILIPSYGIIGAAWATLISQAVASVLANALNSKTRITFIMQCKAFIPFFFK